MGVGTENHCCGRICATSATRRPAVLALRLVCQYYVSANPQMHMISEILRHESLFLCGIGLRVSVSFLEHQGESLMYLRVTRT